MQVETLVVTQQIKVEAEAITQVKVKSSLLEKAADAILCQVFAFLNAREHWKLSRCSNHVNRVSSLPQASPQQLDVSKEMQRVESDYSSNPSHLKNLQRLLTFRPLQLTVLLNSQIKSMEVAQMTQLRELFLTNTISCSFANRPNMEWLSQLTQLTNLKITVDDFYNVTRLPSSITQLDLLKDSIPYALYPSEFILKFTNLQALQILNLPANLCYQAAIFRVGRVFPLLRELSLGFMLSTTKPIEIDEILQSCTNLQSLSISVDSGEFIFPWESLTQMPTFSRLAISLFKRILPQNLFDGLAKVTQLTHLKLAVYGKRQITKSLDISNVVGRLSCPAVSVDKMIATDDANAIMALNYPVTESPEVLPQLTSLSISYNSLLKDASCLSSFASLTELELPSNNDSNTNDDGHARNGSRFPKLPRLRTFHITEVSDNQISALEHYKDQLSEVVLRDPSFSCVDSAFALLPALRKMTKLTSLKLHPRCAIQEYQNDYTALANFRRWLPTVQVEIDNSIE